MYPINFANIRDFILVVATVALALFTARLWNATGDLVRETQSTAVEQLRAYAYVNSGNAFHVDGQGTLQVYSVVGNSGQTPATNVERFVGMEVMPAEDKISENLMIREPGVAVLGPRGELAIVKNWHGGSLSNEQYKSIRNGDLKIYVFGKILFDDIFGEKWETHFCNAYWGTEGLGVPQPTEANPKNTSFGYVSWQARPCETGNKMVSVTVQHRQDRKPRMTTTQYANLLAAVLGAGGTLLLFFNSYGFQPLEGAPWNSEALQQSNAVIKARNKVWKVRQRIGLVLLCGSFVVQAILVFLP